MVGSYDDNSQQPKQIKPQANIPTLGLIFDIFSITTPESFYFLLYDRPCLNIEAVSHTKFHCFLLLTRNYKGYCFTG